MPYRRRETHPTFCARCNSVRRFHGCSCGTIALVGAHPCHAFSWSESSGCFPVASGPGIVFFPSRCLARCACRCRRFSSSSLLSIVPRHEFVSLKFWKSIKTGYLLGSFWQKSFISPHRRLTSRDDISYHDILWMVPGDA
jgi:hypothetical protein